jgi:hypothetical protein
VAVPAVVAVGEVEVEVVVVGEGGRSAVTGQAVGRSSLSPKPKRPFPPCPHASTTPEAKRDKVWLSPQATSATGHRHARTAATSLGNSTEDEDSADDGADDDDDDDEEEEEGEEEEEVKHLDEGLPSAATPPWPLLLPSFWMW